MLSLLSEPECIPEANDVEVRLSLDGLAGQSAVVLGVRTALGQSVSQGAPTQPGPHVAMKLSWYMFEVEREVELAVKEGAPPSAEPEWDSVGWSWQQWYKASLPEGKPTLTAIWK